MTAKALTNTEIKLLLPLACGATAEQAARQAGVSVRTVYRRLKNPEFLRQVQAARADMVQRASGTLTAAGGEAVKTMVELLRAPAPFSVRLGAARGILEMGLRIRDDVEQEQRLAALEALVANPPEEGREVTSTGDSERGWDSSARRSCAGSSRSRSSARIARRPCCGRPPPSCGCWKRWPPPSVPTHWRGRRRRRGPPATWPASP